MAKFAESEVEDAALEWLAGLGYAMLHGPDIGPEGPAPERGSYDEVLLAGRLRKALARLNPHLPAETLEDVLRKVRQTETPSLIEENRRLHRYLVEGVPIEVAREDGSVGGDAARLIDFDDIEANDWLVVNQFTVIEHEHNRRPDVVLFVNGLPLAVIELKNPGDENATLEGAFNQFQTYKDQIPSLFRTNAALMTSDGLQARLGSLTASLERCMPWRTVDGSAVAPKGAPELETVIGGVFEKSRFLTLIRDFTVFEDTGAGLVKIVAGYHQFHAVRRAVASTLRALPGFALSVREDPVQYGLPSVASQERLAALAGAIEWVLEMQQRDSAKEATEEGKKRAHRRFNDAVLALSRAFALASASDEARDIRDEAGFFQTVRAALAKNAPGAGQSSAVRDLAVQQIVSRAVVSTEIADILEAAGLDTPDISILSDEFLAEIQGMEKKNLALEALRKLINGELCSRSRVNVVRTRAFSQRLEEAIARYHSNAITTAEVIQELIRLAKDIRATHRRGEEEGLSPEEIAFYDALAQNGSAVEVNGQRPPSRHRP